MIVHQHNKSRLARRLLLCWLTCKVWGLYFITKNQVIYSRRTGVFASASIKTKDDETAVSSSFVIPKRSL